MKKTILITGASSGIGKATSLHFAKKGWNVIATMRKPEEETELIKFSNIFVTKLEVTDKDSIETAIKQSIERFGHIDALLNNAGYGQQGIFEAVMPEKVKEQFDVNVFGVINVTRAILPHFRSRKDGVIVNITSGVGKVPVPLTTIYSASKFAIEGFSESLSFELESQNIKVKIIEPGYIATNFYQRAANDFAYDATLTDYDNFTEEMNLLFSSFGNSDTATSEDVAKAIYEAITDGTYTLRYVVGPDIGPMIAARDGKSEQEYVSFLRKLFMPTAFENRNKSL
jgi:NAD(P)-dependent dehydrogenase (short-subunit alcohol dehydrogenase family)